MAKVFGHAHQSKWRRPRQSCQAGNYIGWGKSFALAPPFPSARTHLLISRQVLRIRLAFCQRARWRCRNLFVVPIFTPFARRIFFYFCAKFCESFSSGFLIPQVLKEFSVLRAIVNWISNAHGNPLRELPSPSLPYRTYPTFCCAPHRCGPHRMPDPCPPCSCQWWTPSSARRARSPPSRAPHDAPSPPRRR